MNLRTFKSIALLLSVGIFFSACKKKDDDDNDDDSGNSNSSLKKEVVENYAQIVYANYEDALEDAEDLKAAINTFVESPSEANQTAAKNAWLKARESYGTTEAFRFYAGPIDDTEGPEGLLNAWPLDEAFIDYVDGNSNSGIINNTTDYPTLSKSLLESLNEDQGIPENVAIGYHAIEFLLWGQDLSDPSAKEAGKRSYTDFQQISKFKKATSGVDNQERRGEYLKICGELLIDHLQILIDEWKPNGMNYRSDFESINSDDALKNMLTGIGVLAKSELAGERIFTAYENRSQEDEHSCFSDNTHRDIILNALSIKNVYLGEYTTGPNDNVQFFGSSLHDLVSKYDSDLAEEIKTEVEDAYAKSKAIESPFDYAIDTETARPAVLECVSSLRKLGDLFAQAGAEMDITINTAIPE